VAAVVAQLTACFPFLNDEPESDMDLLAQLCALLGLPATTTTQAQVVERVTALKTTAVTPAMPKALLGALALGNDATEAQALSAVVALKAPTLPVAVLSRGATTSS
jgi:hypothetical protein